MGIIRFSVENPVKVAVGVMLLVLFGLLSLYSIGIQLTPDVDRPILTVTTQWRGASPQEVETEIVDPQEEKLKSVAGLQKMTSTCSQGQGTIRLEFPVGVDKDGAYRDVSDKLRQVKDYPEEVEEPTLSSTNADMEQTIAWMILYAKDGTDVATLRTYIEDHVKPILERAEGISEVDVYGGRPREMQIVIDPYRLAARGLTFRDIERALRRQNENTSAGTILDGKRDFSYRTVGEFTGTQDILQTVAAYRDGGPITIGDVATVVDGFRKPVSFVRSKGRPVLAIPARRETGANVIRAMENLRVQVDLANREILAPRGLGLELTQVYDETTYIWSAIRLVIDNIFGGGFLAFVVLLVFLRSFSATAIIAVTIPISVIGTFLIVASQGRSLNVVMLAGMAFAVGNSVDNAIVVLENIYRHLSMGKTKLQAALDGAQEVWGAVFASTCTTIAVFLPVITIQEEAGQLFRDIAVASVASAALSLIVSILVIPPLTSRFFSAKSALATEGRTWRLGVWAGDRIRWVNRTTGRRTAVILGLTSFCLLGGWMLMPGTEYLPNGNKNLVFGLLFSPPAYSIEEFQRMAEIVEEGDPSKRIDGLRPYWEAQLDSPEAWQLAPVTMSAGRDGKTKQVVPPPIEDFFFVSFDGGAFMGCTSQDPTNVRPLEKVLDRAGSRFPGVFAMFNQVSLFSSGSIRSGNTLDLELRGENLDEVVRTAAAVQRKIMSVGYPYPTPSPPSFDLGRPEIRATPDRAKMADLGLDIRDVGFILQACVDGAFVGEFNDHGDRIDMVLKIADDPTASTREIDRVPIFTPTGHIVPLSSAVRFERTTAPQQIIRVEEMPAVTLSIKPPDGVPLQDTMRDIEQRVVKPLRASGEISSSVITALSGSADKLTQANRAFFGDFTDVLRRPRFFGLSPAASILLLFGLVSLIAVVAWGFSGARVAVRTALIGFSALGLLVLGANPQLAMTLLQSRMILALLITYLVMAALFESFAYPFVMMFCVPPAALGGFAALRLVHEISLHDPTLPVQQFDVLTMLGFVILIGIVVNNAILIVHQTLNFMREQGMSPADAVALSVETRTRPIFMTAFTSIVGMLPLVVRPGAGSELYRGLGSVMLGGLFVSTVVTLFVIPAAFTLFLDLQTWFRGADNPARATPQPIPVVPSLQNGD